MSSEFASSCCLSRAWFPGPCPPHAGVAWPDTRYVDNRDGSVSDTLTIEVLVLRIRDAMSGQQLEDAAAASVIARHEGEAVSPTAMLTTQAVEARP